MQRKFSFVEGEYYHIFNRGVNKQPIFLDDSDLRRFQNLLFLCNSDKSLVYKLIQGEPLEWERGKPIANILGYALMPNHFHLICKAENGAALSNFMGKILTAYSMYFNTKYERSGPLMGRPFHARHIDSDEYFRWVFSYVHLNPLDLVDSGWKERGTTDIDRALSFMDSYKYSSYPDYFGTERFQAKILNKDSLPVQIGDLENIETMFAEISLFQGESLE
jgi:putative transposase